MNPRANLASRLALLLCLLSAGSIAFAQSARVFFSTPANLSHNLDNSAFSYSTHLLADARGNVHVIWAEFDCLQVAPFTCTWHLFYTRSVDGGASFPTARDVANQAPGNALFGPQLAIDPAGNVDIAWEGDGTGANIFFAQSTDGGATFSLPINVSLDNGLASQPSLAADSHGAINLVWQSQSLVDQSYSSFFSRSTDGVNFSSPASLCATGQNCSAPQVALDARGNINLVFLSALCPTCASDAMFSRSTDSGSSFSAPLNLSSSSTPAGMPQIAMGPRGSVNVAWPDTSSGTTQVLFTRSNDGTSFSSPVTLSNGAGNSYFPELGIGPARNIRTADLAGDSSAVIGRGRARVLSYPSGREAVNAAWYNDATGKVFFSRSVDRGTTFSSPKSASTAVGGFGTEPYMAVDSDGRINLVWQDGFTSDILFTRSNDGGATFTTPRSVSTSPSLANTPQIVADLIGNLNVVWFDDTTPIEDVFYSRGTSLNVLRKDLRSLPISDFRSGNKRAAVLAVIAAARRALDHQDRALAAGELTDLLQHVSGCGTSPGSNDWIVDCTTQLRIRNSLDILIAGLSH